MGRWARGNEFQCNGRRAGESGPGGCRNLATWLIMSDTRPGDNTMSCDLHVNSTAKLLIERHWAYRPQVVPFQDPYATPLRKRKATLAPVKADVRT